MAYPNNFYNPNYYQPMMQHQQAQPTQVQSSFMSVPSEDVVNTYPVAPGNCVTFKIEGKPIILEKSMGFSQFESPKIERYRIVKEEPILPVEEPKNDETIKLSFEELKSKIELLENVTDGLKKEIAELREGV